MSQKKVDSYKPQQSSQKRETDRQIRDPCMGSNLCVYGCMDRIFRICKDNCQGSFRSEGNGCRYFSDR